MVKEPFYYESNRQPADSSCVLGKIFGFRVKNPPPFLTDNFDKIPLPYYPFPQNYSRYHFCFVIKNNRSLHFHSSTLIMNNPLRTSQLPSFQRPVNSNLPRSLRYYQKGILHPEAWFSIVENDYTKFLGAVNWDSLFPEHNAGYQVLDIGCGPVDFREYCSHGFRQQYAFIMIIWTLPAIISPPADSLCAGHFSPDMAGKPPGIMLNSS